MMSTISAPPSSTLRLPPSVRHWWTMLRISLEERLVYRGDFMLGTLMRFLPFVTQIFLWTAVIRAMPGSAIAGYTLDEIIAYLLLTNVSRAFSSMPALASTISRSILDGTIKKYLIQPVDMIGFLFITRVAHKLVYYSVAAIPFALMFFLCRKYFQGWPDPSVLAAFSLSLIMAFVLGFFLEACIGMIGFWFLEVNSLLFVYMLFNYFLSGQMFPLEFFDKIMLSGTVSLGTLIRLLPFKYLCYFPCRCSWGKLAEMIWPSGCWKN